MKGIGNEGGERGVGCGHKRFLIVESNCAWLRLLDINDKLPHALSRQKNHRACVTLVQNGLSGPLFLS